MWKLIKKMYVIKSLNAILKWVVKWAFHSLYVGSKRLTSMKQLNVYYAVAKTYTGVALGLKFQMS